MIRELAAADRAGKLDRKLRTYTTKSQLLVLDGRLGYLPLSRAEANYLFQVISNRYERSSLILTSNKSVGEWPELFGDHAIATAILDRLLHHSQRALDQGPQLPTPRTRSGCGSRNKAYLAAHAAS